VGYRLLGPRFDYVLPTRPAEWPIMAGHTALGYVLAVGITGAAMGESLAPPCSPRALGGVSHRGTLAVNSAFDKDEGDIGCHASRPPVPANLFGFGMAPWWRGCAVAPAAGCVYRGVRHLLRMSVLYSVLHSGSRRWREDWIINMVGFGAPHPARGWALTGRPIDRPALLVFAAFAPLFASPLPLTQIYQFEEDRRRGDRTLALMLGERASLLLAVGATVLAFLLFALAGLGRGWLTRAPGGGWRTGLLALAFAIWMAVLLPWAVRCRRMTPAQHQLGMYAALGAWAVTDVVVALGFGLD
jgi:hypothetical protein